MPVPEATSRLQAWCPESRDAIKQFEQGCFFSRENEQCVTLIWLDWLYWRARLPRLRAEMATRCRIPPRAQVMRGLRVRTPGAADTQALPRPVPAASWAKAGPLRWVGRQA